MKGSSSRSRGFTTVELMISVAIVGILASIAINAFRDYTRRASISEVVIATSACKSAISENYATLTDAPDAGKWGCEVPVGKTKYVGAVQTSADGVIRIAIVNLDGLVNGKYLHMVPVHADGSVEPLCGVYHAGSLARLREFFNAGGRRVKDALGAITVSTVPAPERILANINTPEQWAATRS